MSLSKEESNFLRFYFLNLKIASKAVRVYFDSVHPPAGLANELAISSVTLKGLRFITKSQLKILYPSPACNVRSEDFDLTLLVCLLRNMIPRESVPITGWDSLPLQADKSIGADLARVKWYRNMLAHNEDGKLSLPDFSQYWADLEGVIVRLGGSSLLSESQSAHHIVLDTSLTDILKTLRVCEVSQEKNRSMVNDLKTTLDNKMSFKEKHENQIQQLQDSLQKGETEAKDFATKLSEIEACKKEINNNEETIKVLQNQSMNEQNQIDKLISQIYKFEIKYEQHDNMLKEYVEQLTIHDREIAKQEEQIAKHDDEIANHSEQMARHDGEITNHSEQMAKHDGEIANHSEQMAKHDEQISANAEDIVYLRKEQHNTYDSSNECKRKRLEDDTKALIEEDIREGTFVTTKAAKDGFLLLKQNGVVLITGHAGTGKSRLSRHILHLFVTDDTSYKCIKLNKLQEWDDMVNRVDHVVILLDDIFGETNCIYNKEKDIPILDKVHAYVCKGNIKVIITIRDTVKRQCLEVFYSHRLFKFDLCDLSSDKYKLCEKEKQDILTIYMKKVRKSDYVYFKKFVDQNGIAILEWDEISEIIRGNPVKGFPLVVYQFVHNNIYFQLGSKFFDRPNEAILDEIDDIRRNGEIHKKFMIQYGVMVYTAINETGINPDDNSNVTEVAEIIDAIYGETLRIKKCHLSDVVKELKGKYLVKIPNQRSYIYHHSTLKESVILSFAQIDDENLNKIIPLLSWTFFMKMVKSDAYKTKEGEVVLRIPTSSYKILAYRLVDIYISKRRRFSYEGVKVFLNNLTETEIFQQQDCVLLTYLLDGAEKTDIEDNHTEQMIKCDSQNKFFLYMNHKDVFLAVLLEILSRKERLYDMFQFILQRIIQLIRTDNNFFTDEYMKAALITSLYQVSSTNNARSVKCVEALLNIADEIKIPVVLDQNMKYTEIEVQDYDDETTTCVFLNLCILNAYQQFNIPLLDYLLSRYHETPFDVNIFLNVCYSKDHVERLPLSSHKSLIWMIERFEDQELIDIDFILKTACYLQMLETVKYLAPRSKSFDAISCLKLSLHFSNPHYNAPLPYNANPQECDKYDKGIFNFLFSKIDNSSTNLISIVMLFLQENNIPDYVFDAFLPVCLNNNEILTLACRKANIYVAKQIMEKSQNVDIQSALSACIAAPSYGEHAEIVKYIFEKFGYKQFDLKALCQQACPSTKIKVIEWCVKTDLTLLDVDFIINSALEQFKPRGLEILEYTIDKIELSNLEKGKVLKSIAENYKRDDFTRKNVSTKILKIVSAIWNSTDNKDGLQMERIFLVAYKSNCFNLLVWIYENCNSYISIDVGKLLTSTCEDGSVEVAKWVLQTFESISQVIDGGKLFMSACNKLHESNNSWFSCDSSQVCTRISMVNLFFRHFQIKPLDLKSEFLRIINLDKHLWVKHIYEHDKFPDLLVSMLEKCFHCLSTQDLEVVMSKSLDQTIYVLVNWILENDGLLSFNKQDILNKACGDGELKTIKLVTKYASSLDMNEAIIHVCIPHVPFVHSFSLAASLFSDSNFACLKFLWKETNHAFIDMRRIVSVVCEHEYVSNEVMTWILQNFPYNQIPINEVLISCCKQTKLYHVRYIFHKVDNELLDITEAFCNVCRKTAAHYSLMIEHVMLVDFLFQRIPNKTSTLFYIRKKLLRDESYNLILYFFKKGYTMDIDMTYLMNQACRVGHVRLVQWILTNVQHTKLDIKFAFNQACKFVIQFESKEDEMLKMVMRNVSKGQQPYHRTDNIRDSPIGFCLQCVALIWHYIQDVNKLDVDTVLKTITKETSMSILENEIKIGREKLSSMLGDNTKLETMNFTEKSDMMLAINNEIKNNILDIPTECEIFTDRSSPLTSTRFLINWIKYIQNINQRIMCKSKTSMLNIEEKSQQVHDAQHKQ